MRRGTANLPLHGGKCPPWLFVKMKELGAAIVETIAQEYGPAEVLRRLSEPYWFQAFGCVLGFDWHSSGVTTTVLGALKEGLKERERDLGLYVCGGKGGTSRKTPSEIAEKIDRDGLSLDADALAWTSRLTAKVDNTALLDGYNLYHHVFLFTATGEWAVVQQGMNDRWARRYHWLSEGVEDFVSEPHSGIAADRRERPLNLVAAESAENRRISAALGRENPEKVVKEFRRLIESSDEKVLRMTAAHPVPRAAHLEKTLLSVYEGQPREFTDLLGIKGVGPKTVRALALVAEVTYGARTSYSDPARFSFAHGGKDGHPFPVDREAYNTSIEVLRKGLREAKMGHSDRQKALKRLALIGE